MVLEAVNLPRLCRYHFRKVTRHLRRYLLQSDTHHIEPVVSVTQNVRTLSSSSPTSNASKHICVVGSGPAGFYTAQQLLKGNPDVRVDMYEKLAVPFGLVRFGVAPDHPEVKNVINTFTQTAGNDRCSFLGNVFVGRDVSLQELREAYSAVVLSYGADDDRVLGIPGEHLENVIPARSFVGWYNGLPDDKHIKINLDVETAVIFGHGNVALDVARILLTPVDILRKTDITDHALQMLNQSRVKKVVLVGRRGPLQVAFTIKELREMTKLPGTHPVLSHQDFSGIDKLIPDLPRPRRRLTELMYKTCMESANNVGDKKTWQLKFLRSPMHILGDKAVTGVRLGFNILQGENLTKQQAIPTQGSEDLECGLILRSIGYRSVSIDSNIPFDDNRGVVSNDRGRVKGLDGVYCSGWVGLGPVGVILTTMTDGFDTGKLILKDLSEGKLQVTGKSGKQMILKLLNNRGVQVVSFSDWEKIDKVETEVGEKVGKPREKMVDVSDMLHTAAS